MSTDSHTSTEPRGGDGGGDGGGGHRSPRGRGSLLRVEVARLRARRLVQVVVALGLLGLAATAVIGLFVFATPSAELLAEATRQRDAELVLSAGYYQDCLVDAEDQGQEPEFYCGTPPTAEDLPIDYFIDKDPFTRSDYLPGGALAVGLVAALLTFLIGATAIGAEWSTRSIVALLFWEPRRLRVLATKTAVVAAAGALLALVGQVLWFGIGSLLVAVRGIDGEIVPPGAGADLLGLEGRAVLLGAFVALFGFGMANLVRNTGAALGVGFVYFAVVETALRSLLPRSQPFLITDNVLALLLPGGQTIFLYGTTTIDEDTGSFSEVTEILIGNLRGGLTLGLYLAALLALGFWLFRRRDLH